MFRSLSQLTAPDPRFASIARFDPATGSSRPITVADHFSSIEAVRLSSGVPEDICTAFDRARNAFLYAWFSYELTTLAAAQGYGSLEMALRSRILEREPAFAQFGLKALFRAARRLRLFDGMALPANESPDALDRWADGFPKLRNYLAHGTSYVSMPGVALSTISRCALIINHLYR